MSPWYSQFVKKLTGKFKIPFKNETLLNRGLKLGLLVWKLMHCTCSTVHTNKQTQIGTQ